MAKLVLTNAKVTIAGTDLSDHIASISLATQYDLVETTQFGQTSKQFVAGLAANTITFEFYQDFQAGSVESIIYPLLGTATTCRIKPIDAARSADNPEYIMDGTNGSGRILISEWQALNAAVGEITTVSVTWPISGDVIKLTTP
jgi:hypothetical protein